MPVNYGLAIYGTREKMRQAMILSDVRMASALKLDEWRDNKNQFDELIRLRKSDVFARMRTAIKRQAVFLSSRTDLTQTRLGISQWGGIHMAVTRDTRPNHNNIVPFWSREAQHLKTIKNEDGTRIFIDDEFRYPLKALDRQSTSDDILELFRIQLNELRRFGLHEMSMPGGNFSSFHQIHDSIRRVRNPEIYSFQNDRFGLSVHHRPKKYGGGWILRVSENFERSDKRKQYAETNNLHSNNPGLKYGLSNGHDYAVFKTKGEALATLRMFNKQASQLIWRGQNPVNKMLVSEKLGRFVRNSCTELYSIFWKEIKNTENKREAAFDVFWFALGAASFRLAFSMFSLPISLTSTLAVSLGVRRAKDNFFKFMDWAGFKILGPKAIYGETGQYIADIPDNLRRRINPKPDTSKNHFLEVLNGEDMDLTNNDSELTPDSTEFDADQFAHKLTKMGVNALTSQPTSIDAYTSLHDIYNGVSTLTNWNPQRKVVTTYVRYNPILETIPQISLSNEEKEFLAGGIILKISDPKGKSKLTCRKISFAQMNKELKTILFKEYPQRENGPGEVKYEVPSKAVKILAENQIKWIFNGDSSNLNREQVINPKIDDDIEPIKHESRLRALMLVFGTTPIEIEKPTPELIAYMQQAEYADQQYPVNALN